MSLSLAFSEIKERSAKKYHTKCQIEKDVVHAAVKQALEAKAKNCGRMPDKWYTKYVAEMRQTPAGCHMVITAEDIRNIVLPYPGDDQGQRIVPCGARRQGPPID